MPPRSAPRAMVAFALVAAIGLGLSGCSTTADEVAAGPKPAPTAPVGGFQMPTADPSVQLDAATQQKCEQLSSFQLYSYTAHVTKSREPEPTAKLISDLVDNTAKTKAAIPELATSLDTLAADGTLILSQPLSTTPQTGLAPPIDAANTAVLTYLRGTCKYVG